MLQALDWWVIIGFLVLIVSVGLSFRKKAEGSVANFFLGGRNLPWYMAGISMVATTFAADTPLAVTELVGESGISGNWLWWNFLAGGMLTTFFFANLWRRANIVTEIEFIELRYSGKPAAFLRGFKSVYLGLFMNILIIGWVNLAMITILEGFFGISNQDAFMYTAIGMALVALYSSVSGLMGVVVTDIIQFFIAIGGSIILAYLVINSEDVGGIQNLKDSLPDGALNFLPAVSSDGEGSGMLTISATAFLAFFGFIWWTSWYPGSEPGGGGYVAQRMMSTKNEKHAVYSTLFFQIAHYCLRPWPWVLVGLSAMVIYALPKNLNNDILKNRVEKIKTEYVVDDAFFSLSGDEIKKQYGENELIVSNIDYLTEVNALIAKEKEGDEDLSASLTYSKDKRFGYVYAMKNYLPTGLVGLLLVSFFAAYMSTISTQLNWGASYLVNDLYNRFIEPEASQKALVNVSRITTILLMIVGLIVSQYIDSISGVWSFIMECGAGLGLVLIIRWYWWRINAWSEISATIAPFIAYAFVHYIWDMKFPNSFFITVGFTTVVWFVVTFITSPTRKETLHNFYNRIQPDGLWSPVRKELQLESKKSNIKNLTVCWISAVFMTYSILFALGKFILLEPTEGAIATGLAIVCFWILQHFMKKTRIME